MGLSEIRMQMHVESKDPVESRKLYGLLRSMMILLDEISGNQFQKQTFFDRWHVMFIGLALQFRLMIKAINGFKLLTSFQSAIPSYALFNMNPF